MQRDMKFDHGGCVVPSFPHLKGRGPSGAQVGRCPTVRLVAEMAREPQGRCHCQGSLSFWGIWGTRGPRSTEIEEFSSKSEPAIHLSGQSFPVPELPRPLYGKGFTLEAVNLKVRIVPQLLPLP